MPGSEFQFWLAVYGAVVATLVAASNLFEFFARRRRLGFREQVSFGDEVAFYRIAITNRSPAPFTIYDLVVFTLSRDERGQLQEDVGVDAKRHFHLVLDEMSKEQPEPLMFPIVLSTGHSLIIGMSSKSIIESLAQGQNNWSGKSWTNTETLRLCVETSIRQRDFRYHFKMQGDELKHFREV